MDLVFRMACSALMREDTPSGDLSFDHAAIQGATLADNVRRRAIAPLVCRPVD